MTRLVVDTNIVVSAFVWGGVPQQVFTFAMEQQIVLLSSQQLLIELQKTLSKPKLQPYIVRSGKTSTQIVSEFSRLVEVIEPAKVPKGAVRDRDDLIVLGAALGGHATHIVTGDKDLLTLKAYRDIHIQTPRVFVDSLSL